MKYYVNQFVADQFLYKISVEHYCLSSLIVQVSVIRVKIAKEDLERFLIECCKTKTKTTTVANHNKRKQHNEPMRTLTKYT